MTEAVTEAPAGPPPGFLDEWVDALESGEYQRTVGTLRGFQYTTQSRPVLDPSGAPCVAHCCLGVGVDILQKNHGDWLRENQAIVIAFDGGFHPGASGSLQPSIRVEDQVSGHTSTCDIPNRIYRLLDVPIEQDELIRMNDDEGADFRTIAGRLRQARRDKLDAGTVSEEAATS